MIHLSQETANYLIASGKESWIEARESMIEAKGKGTMQTYWLIIKEKVTSETKASSVAGSDENSGQDDRNQRLIDWNVDLLQRYLKRILAMRVVDAREITPTMNSSTTMIIDEVKDFISLQQEPRDYLCDPRSIELPEIVKDQLHEYVTTISTLYRDNSFHCFEHSSNITQSVSKLLGYIESPADQHIRQEDTVKNIDLHNQTFGITSDPLVAFACIFSALIHDADHTGVPNSQLIKEQADVAKMYQNRSVAEQNSIELAWELLMEPTYENLRRCIYQNQEEFERFRQLIVHAVIATDITDSELAQRRKQRWIEAFSKGDGQDVNKMNRKATVTIEYLIQASNVAHMMQHWHIYLKWNERLFQECYQAYRNGRGERDPSETWYKGELEFFDHFVIPLVRNLKESGVIGVASDEYSMYAIANRDEWEIKGRDIVKLFKSQYESF